MVLPGISGGTMAFILGIYEKLLDEIAKLRFQQVKYLLNLFTLKKEKFFKNFSSFISVYDWSFITPLFVGSIVAIALFVFIAPPLMKEYSVEFYTLIFGLVIASLYSPFKKMKKNSRTFSLLILSFCLHFLCFYIFKESPVVHREITPFLFLPTGFLIATALIIPGVSGSYILILLGLYQTTLEVLKEFNLFAIFFFLLGIILGFFTMVHLIKRLLKKHLDESLAVIIGLILGSLYGVWILLEKSLGNQLYFETDKRLFLLYVMIPVFILIIYKTLYRFVKKTLIK